MQLATNRSDGGPQINIEAKKHDVHATLAHSYALYFIAFLFGMILDFIFPFKVLNQFFSVPLGIFLIICASAIVIWAQHTSHEYKKDEELSKETFCKGPYCYTRSPTHWGLFLLMLGFGLLANTIFIILFSLISFFVTRLVFIRRQESFLESKYGQAYSEYKKIVHL